MSTIGYGTLKKWMGIEMDKNQLTLLNKALPIPKNVIITIFIYNLSYRKQGLTQK